VAPASRNRAAAAPRAGKILVATAKRSCESAWHLRASNQIVMCSSERFHRRFSSIDYDARCNFLVSELRANISGTLTATAFSERSALEQLRQIKFLALFELR
jgi:hypothetical protein